MGKVACNMDAVSYHEYKPQLQQQISEVYHSLASGYDIMVLEGAGSPAEINLRDCDIVNMGMARSPMRQCCWWPISIVAGYLPLFTAHWPCWNRKKKLG
ncbi:Cobyric acid synthase [Serratia fonticola]|uniref:Cobyric acid synthase n=1 Tax=Serratia fonticola TaxID=47917 RepID=A0A4U9THG2_SERFO|nr:Cobyric acid synthase [Serratia fonticola]